MASIKFKRGSYTALQTLKADTSKIEDGCFYLAVDDAVDSAKLFVGKEVNNVKQIVPVNQGILQFPNMDALKAYTAGGKVQPGDFAYETTGNILAIYSGGRWVQINTTSEDDEYLEAISYTVNVSEGVATVRLTGDMKHDTTAPTDAFSIQGAGGIVVSASGKAITVTGDPYELSASSTTGGVSLDLEGTNSGNDSHVVIKGGNYTDVSRNNSGEVVIEGNALADVSIAPTANSGDGFLVSVQDGYNTVDETFDPTIKLDASSSDIHFVGGTAVLNVYSKDQVNALFKSYDAVVYKGTVGTQTSTASNVGNITVAKRGDCYKSTAEQSFYQPDDNTEHVDLKVGDLIIANGTEDDDPASPTYGYIAGNAIHWDVIPSGDEIVDYTLSPLEGAAVGAQLVYDNSETRGIIRFQSNTDTTGAGANDVDPMTFAKTVDGDSTIIKVGHAAPTAVSGTNSTVEQVAANKERTSIQYVTGIITDKWGHYQGVNTGTFTPTDTNITVDTFATTIDTPTGGTVGAGVEVKPRLALLDGAGDAMTPVTATFSITSNNSNLTLTPSGTNGVVVDMVWGEF